MIQRKKILTQLWAAAITLLISTSALAWEHGVSLGYGGSNEIGESYSTYGPYLNVKLYKFKKLDRTLILTIDGSVTHWQASSAQNKDLTTIGLAGAFRAYFTPPERHYWRPYLQVASGPAFLSSKWLGNREQGAHLGIIVNIGAGLEVGPPHNTWDFNWRLVHYCNAGIFKPNQSWNMLYVFSIGYLF